MEKIVNFDKVSSSKLKGNHTEFIKRILPRSGSYNLESQHDITNSKILNDAIELNSAEPIDDNNVNSYSNEAPLLLDRTNMTGLTNSENDGLKLNSSHMIESFSSASMPKKKTCFGFPLLCCTYIAAIYSLLAYGATSLLSIIELMMNNSPKLFPLYLLLAGYLLITLMSFLLIVAIQREKLNIILFWIISISVFILPEIGLNIVLAENSFNWLNSTEGLYTLVALVIRVTVDLPCIGIILAYHINRTRRNNFLQKMIKPLKRNIMNGEVLKSYNNLEINPLYPATENMPKQSLQNKEENNSESFVKKEDTSSVKSYPSRLGFINNSENGDESDQSYDENPDESQHLNNVNQYHYKFYPETDYEIYVRPSKNGQFAQRFINLDDFQIIQKHGAHSLQRKNKKNLNNPRKHSKQIPVVQNNVKNNEYNTQMFVNTDEAIHNQYPQNVFQSNILGQQTKPEYDSIEKNMQFFDESNVIPIKHETTKTPRERKRSLINFGNQTLPFTAEKEIRRKYMHLLGNNRAINVNAHQIYLPTPSSMLSAHFPKENGYLPQNDFDNKSTSLHMSQRCNCVNIASCSKDKLNEFLHSNDCVFSKRQISASSMRISNPDLFIQRHHF